MERLSKKHRSFTAAQTALLQSGAQQSWGRAGPWGMLKVGLLFSACPRAIARLGAGAEGVRMKEGASINKSLLTLGTVINKLSEGVAVQGEQGGGCAGVGWVVQIVLGWRRRVLQRVQGWVGNTMVHCEGLRGAQATYWPGHLRLPALLPCFPLQAATSPTATPSSPASCRYTAAACLCSCRSAGCRTCSLVSTLQ